MTWLKIRYETVLTNFTAEETKEFLSKCDKFIAKYYLPFQTSQSRFHRKMKKTFKKQSVPKTFKFKDYEFKTDMLLNYYEPEHSIRVSNRELTSAEDLNQSPPENVFCVKIPSDGSERQFVIHESKEKLQQEIMSKLDKMVLEVDLFESTLNRWREAVLAARRTNQDDFMKTNPRPQLPPFRFNINGKDLDVSSVFHATESSLRGFLSHVSHFQEQTLDPVATFYKNIEELKDKKNLIRSLKEINDQEMNIGQENLKQFLK